MVQLFHESILCVCVMYVSTEVCLYLLPYCISLLRKKKEKNWKEKPWLRDFNQISRDKKLLTMSTAASAGAWEEGLQRLL